jgi:hypothetical protein
MIRFKQKGDFHNTEKFFKNAETLEYSPLLVKYAELGVEALASATPVRTGLTRDSWSYEIRKSTNSIAVYWSNSNIVNGVPIAVILEYGHGTQNGGYVQGRHYIDPAIQPIFDQMANDAWKEVTQI